MLVIVRLVLKNPSRLRALITIHGLSLSRFADKNNISKAYFSRIINGKCYPAPVTARKIAEGIGKKVPDVFLIKMLTQDNEKS